MSSENYGDIPFEELQSKTISGRSWTDIDDLDEAAAGRSVLICGFAQAIRQVGKKRAFVVLRDRISTVQCVLSASDDTGVSMQIIKFAASISKESVVDIEGVVSLPEKPIEATTQKVEIQVRKVHCINRAIPTLPFNLQDAARSEAEFHMAEQSGQKLARVHQDTRLDHRVLDLRTPANQAIFRIESHIGGEAGTEIEPMSDLNTEAEKKLGRLVKEKYGTEFFILHRYPLAVRPFYTMPCYDDPAYSNSFDVFIRDGYGAPPHGGFGAGLERVVMLFCGLDNIRKTSLFPRDPHRLEP
ncbi:hypothetical protein ACQ4PT_028731 [Festuca glaucescens]